MLLSQENAGRLLESNGHHDLQNTSSIVMKTSNSQSTLNKRIVQIKDMEFNQPDNLIALIASFLKYLKVLSDASFKIISTFESNWT